MELRQPDDQVIAVKAVVKRDIAHHPGSPLPRPCARGYLLARIPGSATTELVTVGAASYGTSWATLNTFARAGGRWVHQRGPWAARLG
jgi:hypothetical protein